MRAGLLKETISIYRNEFTKNEYGEETEGWRLVTTTRAGLRHDSGTRAVEDGAIVYTAIKTFQVYYYVDVDDFDRIEWNGKMYRILNIDPVIEQQCKFIRTELIQD